MEKIKYSYFRLSLISIIVLTILKFIKHLIWPEVSILSTLYDVMFLSSAFLTSYFIQNYLMKGLFFTNDYLIINSKKDIKIKWNDLTIDTSGFSLTSFRKSSLKIYSKDNPEIASEFELHWFNEKSIIYLVNKYSPPGNDLHKFINHYITSRNIKI